MHTPHRRLSAGVKNRSLGEKKSKKDYNDKALAVMLYCVCMGVAFGTVFFNYSSLQSIKFDWERVNYDRERYLTNKEAFEFLNAQRKLFDVREEAYDYEAELKSDLNELMKGSSSGDNGSINYQIYVSEDGEFNDWDTRKFSLIQSKVAKSAVSFTKDMSIMSGGQVYDVYDIKDLDNSGGDGYCLSFSIRTRNLWYFGRAKRNCKVVEYIIESWMTSSYLFMGIGTGKAQREGNQTKELFKYVHEEPAHWIVQTWYFDAQGQPSVKREDILLSIEYKIPYKPITELHCLTMIGTFIDGTVHQTEIDNSCHGAKKNIDSFNTKNRTYDVSRRVKGNKGNKKKKFPHDEPAPAIGGFGLFGSKKNGEGDDSFAVPSTTVRDSSIVFQNSPKPSLKMKIGKFLYPISAVSLDKDPQSKDACLYVSIMFAKHKHFSHFVFIEEYCELFLHDVKNAQKYGLKVHKVDRTKNKKKNNFKPKQDAKKIPPKNPAKAPAKGDNKKGPKKPKMNVPKNVKKGEQNPEKAYKNDA